MDTIISVAMTAIFAVGELRLVVGNAVFVVVVLQGRFDGLLRQHGAVHFVGRKTLQSLGNRVIGQLHRFGDRLALDHFRRHRGRGDSRAAAEGLELHIHDGVVFNLQVNFHNVAAFGVANSAYAVGIFDQSLSSAQASG